VPIGRRRRHLRLRLRALRSGIAYTRVFEDDETDRRGLALTSGARVLVIASAGDRALDAVAWGAGQVRVLTTERTAETYAVALAKQMGIAQAILRGLGYEGEHFAPVGAEALEEKIWALQPARAPQQPRLSAARPVFIACGRTAQAGRPSAGGTPPSSCCTASVTTSNDGNDSADVHGDIYQDAQADCERHHLSFGHAHAHCNADVHCGAVRVGVTEG